MITHIVLFKFKPETTEAEIQQLAEGLGGSLSFCSNEGGGSCFELSLTTRNKS